jgi:capsular exopolysaccharide synthesis family protein
LLIPQVAAPQSLEDGKEAIDLGRVIALLRRRLPLILGIMGATIGLGLAITIYQRLFSPIYEGGFSLLVGDPVNSVGKSNESESENNLKGLALQSSRVPDIQISQDLIDVLVSPLLLKPVSTRLGIEEDKLASKLKIERRSGDASSVLDVTLEWHSRNEGEKILDSLKNEYLKFSTNQRRDILAQSISYLNEQAPALQEKLSMVQGQLSDFRIRNKFLDPSTEGDGIIKQLQDLENRQDEILRKEAELKALAAVVRSGNLSSQQIPGLGQKLSTEPKATGSVEARTGTGLDQLQQDLTQLEKELAIADATFQPTSPLVQSLKARTSRVRTLLQQRQLDAIEATLNQINGEKSEIDRQRKGLQRRFNLNPSLIKQNDAIQQRLEVAKANLTAYIKAREDIRLLVAQRTVPWKVISPPTFDNTLVSPNISRNLLLSILAGISLGAGGAFLREKILNVYATPKDVEEALGLPLLGTLSHMSIGINAKDWNNSSKDINEEVRVQREYLRNLYTRVKLLNRNKRLRVIAITSTLHGEGKSTLTALFAQTLSDLGKRVLVVDANLREPVLHNFYEIDNCSGLSTLLSKASSTPEELIRHLDAKIDFVSAGPIQSDPVNLLSSERCQAVIDELRSLDKYEFILFDLSPSLELSDPLLITECMDGILFVVSLDHVNRDLPTQTLQRIKSTGINIIGVVSNEVKSSKAKTLAIADDMKQAIARMQGKDLRIPLGLGSHNRF